MKEVTGLEELLALYGQPMEGAIAKEQTAIGQHYRMLIESSPFCALATIGPHGLDCTPRGDHAGFVRVVDERTLELPDRKGNNRIDSLRNILTNPFVALLFLIPGRKETMRVNGHASIVVDPEVLASHAVDDKVPTTVIRVSVDRAFYQCGKATMRSSLWDPSRWPDIDHLPTTGTIAASFRDGLDAASYDANLDQGLRDTMY